MTNYQPGTPVPEGTDTPEDDDFYEYFGTLDDVPADTSNGDENCPFAIPEHLKGDDINSVPSPPSPVGTIVRASMDDGVHYTAMLKAFLPFHAAQQLESMNSNGFGSSGAERTSDLLAKMANDPGAGLRELTIANEEMIERISSLQKEMPNFEAPLSAIRRALMASWRAQVPVYFDPMILMGEPGTGKTRVCRKIAETLNVPFSRISMVTSSGAQMLSGTDATWKVSRPGKVAELIVKKGSADPIIMLDEVDKVVTTSLHDHPLDALHDCWEKENALHFKDDALQVVMDISHVRWLASANDISGIRPSLLDRAQVYEIAVPDQDQMRVICRSIYAEAAAGWHGFFAPDITKEVCDRLVACHPRAARKVLHAALVNAAADGRPEVSAHDVDQAMAQMAPRHRLRIGFR